MGFQFTTGVSADGRQLLGGVGRVVQGDVFEGNTKDDKGQPLVFQSGPNAGQPKTQWFIAVAFPKQVQDPQTGQFIDNPAVMDLYTRMQQEARTGYANLFNAQGQCTHPQFAWKFVDGDNGVDQNGKANKDKTGFPGCWVFKFGTNYAPKVVVNGAYTTDPRAIKRGDYVRIMGDCAANIGSKKPGLYLNHSAVEFAGYGEEIRGGVDAIGGFAAAGAAILPPGASLTPLAPPANMAMQAPAMGAPGMQPGMGAPGMQPGMGAPGMQPAMGAPAGMPMQMGAPGMHAAGPGMPQPAMGAPGMAGAGHAHPGGIVPNHQFVQSAIGAPAMGNPAMPAQQPITQLQPPPMQQPLQPPAQPTYTPTQLAQGYTMQQWMAQGYTAEQLVQSGYFIRS